MSRIRPLCNWCPNLTRISRVSLAFPANGNWGAWSQWSGCSVSCGTGSIFRNRACNNPAPSSGGQTCPGNANEVQQCVQNNCGINGGWGPWQDWGACSVTCGTGTRQRLKFCNNPVPSNGGLFCEGSDTDTEFCTLGNCGVNGNWGTWTPWSGCSVSCGNGIITRSRECNNPPPSGSGISCVGDAFQTNVCVQGSCAVNGNWGSWSSFGTCSQSCGTGSTMRQRFCNSPAPSGGGLSCPGEQFDVDVCVSNNCNVVNGNWGGWSGWGGCSVSCGSGTQTRNRNCNNPAPSVGGIFCSGLSFDTQGCFAGSCVTSGNWGSWSQWGTCSVTCGGGTQSRTRQCDNPPPTEGGSCPSGSSFESQTCNTNECSCTDKAADVIFMVDNSGSINFDHPDNWKTTKEFVANLTEMLDIGSSQTRVGVIRFSTSVITEFHLNDYFDKQTIKSQILAMDYENGETDTTSAFETVIEDGFTTANGDRPNVDNLLIVVTDGVPSKRIDEATPAAERAMGSPNNIDIYTVGIGNAIDESYLKAWSSEPKQLNENYWTTPSFSGLMDIISSLTTGVCGEEPVECLESPYDIVFVLDSSGSIRDQNPEDGSYDNWELVLNFVANMINRLNIGRSATQVGVVTFANVGESHIYLNDFTRKADLVEAVRQLDYNGGNTNTSGGIREMHFNQHFKRNNGARDEANKITIILTDGKSTYDANRTIDDAEAARDAGIKILTVGVTDAIDESELRDMSSSPQEEGTTYWTSSDFQALDAIANEVIRQACVGEGGSAFVGAFSESEWSTWGEWSDCSATCGAGSRTRTRECEGGVGACEGAALEREECTNGDCDLDAQAKISKREFGCVDAVEACAVLDCDKDEPKGFAEFVRRTCRRKCGDCEN